MTKIPEPVKVSPLIKFFRYSFLVAGIIYGASRLKTLQVIEEGKKEQRERRKLEKEARLAEEKQAASERDIESIIAIFKGNPQKEETASKFETEEVNSLESGNLGAEGLKQAVQDEKTCKMSDDLSTCTAEEVKQMVQNNKTAPSPTVETEFGSTVQDNTSNESTDVQKGNEKNDIFSNSLNLTTPKNEKKTTQAKSNILGYKSKEAEDNVDYFVEDFSEKVPYADSKTNQEDFQFKTEK